jgi:DNA polymerase elongation subunit (family B)
MSKFYKNVFKMYDKIYAITDEGKEIVDFKPTMFINRSIDKVNPWKTMKEETVYPIQPGSMKDTDNFIEQYKNVSGIIVNGFTNYVSQYISDMYPTEIEWDMDDLNIVAIDIETQAEIQPGLETSGTFPNWRDPVQGILLITLVDLKTKTPITFGSKIYTGDKTNYIYCENERVLLTKFLNHWKSDYPDIITGWNNNTFDMPYIYHRMNKILGKDITNQLSPFGICKPCPPRSAAAKSFLKEGEDRNICVRLYGISTLDYMELFKKYGRGTYESYKLDHIAQEVLGHTKLNHDEFEQFKDFYNGNPIPDLYGNELQVLAYYIDNFIEGNHQWFDAYNSGLEYTKENIDNILKQLSWDKFVDYNIIDTTLIFDFEDKLNLLALVVATAYEVKINFEDTFSPVATWETLIYNYQKEHKITLPLPNHQNKTDQFAGAFVKDPKIGKHKYLVSFDLNSLYPHEAMQFNISPETISDVKLDIDVDYLLAKRPLPDNGLSISATGWCYRKDKQGVIPTIMEKYYRRRKEIKKQMLQWQQEYEYDKTSELAKKISIASVKEQSAKIDILNSGYGCIGQGNFLFYDVRLVESITYGGKLSILWASQVANDTLNRVLKTENEDFVIYNDTDSVGGDSIIRINGDEQSIESFYDSCEEFIKRDEFNRNFVKPVSDTFTLSINPITQELESKQIKYVMKHKVKKKMFKITVNGKSVNVTADHSIIVRRNGKIIDVKPTEISRTDELISITTEI